MNRTLTPMSTDVYDPQVIEPKWQKVWLEQKAFAAPEPGIKKKRYILDMFPYPSGDGLHVGHAKIYTASDVVSRYLRLKGFAVLHPTGWDAFGLPTENSAIKLKIHPRELTERNIKRFREQMQRLGLSYDWDREINTTDPNYYKWTQWIFLQLYKMGLAYEATVPINWCPTDQTGLANEEVIDGKCERCGTPVEQRPMRQWMLKITRYADQLLSGLGGLDWPKYIVELQHNWIGRSEGADITFEVTPAGSYNPPQGSAPAQQIHVFTTRADTVFGATYLVLAPEHPLVDVVTTIAQQQAVTAYRAQTAKATDLERQNEARPKTGIFTGGYVYNPINHERIPIWIADYVLLSYGTGAIMAVPAHDARDYAFAQTYQLPIKQVIIPAVAAGQVPLPYTDEGVLIDSDRFDGLTSADARERIIGILQQSGKGKKSVHYKLRDWVFSRQRYWGEPIPLIHCEKCGIVPVREEELPVTLPEVDAYHPTGTGESPLAAIESWVQVKCPTCSRMGRRETNTMPQWAGSSWYFLRYIDPHNDQALASPEQMAKWLPIDVYIGGAEHAVLHLLYARFWYKALHDAGIVSHEEPFKRLRSVGLVIGEDGQKMSKSRGNVINPDEVIDQYGADALRLYEMFMGPFEQSSPWNTKSIAGVHRFLKRTWQTVRRLAEQPEAAVNGAAEVEVQRLIKRVSESIELFKFNTAVSAAMEFLNFLEKQDAVPHNVLERFIVVLSPLAPHITEELWQRLGQTAPLSGATWPTLNLSVLKQTEVSIPVQVNGRVRATLKVAAGTPQEQVQAAAVTLANVKKHVGGKTIARVVFVPDRLLNLVTN